MTFEEGGCGFLVITHRFMILSYVFRKLSYVFLILFYVFSMSNLRVLEADSLQNLQVLDAWLMGCLLVDDVEYLIVSGSDGWLAV